MPITLKARYVFPVEDDPIPDGEVAIARGQIVAVGRKLSLANTLDLGNAAILPGFVNAHAHLEFSYLSQPLGRRGMGFVDWIREVIAARKNRTEPFERSFERGMEEAISSGTTTLGEIAQPGWTPMLRQPGNYQLTVFLELIAPTRSRVPEALELARRHIAHAQHVVGWRPGLSPHAPYSVHPDLLADVVTCLAGAGSGVVVAVHLAESREEIEYLQSGGGPFREFLGALPDWDETSVAPKSCPADYLRLLSQAERSLVVHGNYLTDEEIALAASCRERLSVVYCPRTHAYFEHPPYPLGEMLSAGVRVALGTDSRASSPDMNMAAEMCAAARQHPDVPRAAVLRMATLSGAEALGVGHSTGSIAVGKRADLAILRLPDRDAADPHDLLFDSDEPIAGTWMTQTQ